MVTIKDIAALSGVSIGTVSTILNRSDNTIKVRETTRKRVLEAAGKLKYTPNLNAKALKMDRSFVIGVMAPRIVGSFVPDILEGIEDFFMENNYSMLLSEFEDESEFMSKCRIMKQKRVEGIIVVSGNDELNRVYASGNIALPLIGVGYSVPFANSAFVKVDGRKIAYIATRYLLNLGHRNIAFLYHGKYYTDRVDGWRQALTEYDIPKAGQLLLPDGIGYEGGREMFRRLMLLKEMPTALLAYSDELAAGIMNEAFAQGFKVPEDLSIIGTDDMSFSKMLRPALTTIKQPKGEQGKIAAQLMNAILNKKSPENVLLEPELIIRDSCRKYVKP